MVYSPRRPQSHVTLNLHKLCVYTQYRAGGHEHDDGPYVELEIRPVVLLPYDNGRAHDCRGVSCARHCVVSGRTGYCECAVGW
jgi:hypothetical protein